MTFQRNINEQLTSSQAACHLGVSIRTVQRLAQSGQLKVERTLPIATGVFLFDPDEVERVKREREQASRGSR